ncbi:unnamed protein product, partial [Ectocarpus sp. 13 AM-2016]
PSCPLQTKRWPRPPQSSCSWERRSSSAYTSRTNRVEQAIKASETRRGGVRMHQANAYLVIPEPTVRARGKARLPCSWREADPPTPTPTLHHGAPTQTRAQ